MMIGCSSDEDKPDASTSPTPSTGATVGLGSNGRKPIAGSIPRHPSDYKVLLESDKPYEPFAQVDSGTLERKEAADFRDKVINSYIAEWNAHQANSVLHEKKHNVNGAEVYEFTMIKKMKSSDPSHRIAQLDCALVVVANSQGEAKQLISAVPDIWSKMPPKIYSIASAQYSDESYSDIGSAILDKLKPNQVVVGLRSIQFDSNSDLSREEVSFVCSRTVATK